LFSIGSGLLPHFFGDTGMDVHDNSAVLPKFEGDIQDNPDIDGLGLDGLGDRDLGGDRSGNEENILIPTRMMAF